jgi:sugar/nucleoside kinase (ribokinase family)
VMLRDELCKCSVRTDHLKAVPGPSGQAIVMLQPGGQNSIIIVGGANAEWPELSPGQRLSSGARSLIRSAGAVLLQREVPEEINLEAATVRIGRALFVQQICAPFESILTKSDSLSETKVEQEGSVQDVDRPNA